MMSTFVVINVYANGLGRFKSAAMIQIPEPNRNDSTAHTSSRLWMAFIGDTCVVMVVYSP